MSLIRTLWRCAFSPRLFKIYEVTWIGLADVSTIHLFSIFRLRNLHKKLRLQCVCVCALQKSYEARNLERWGDQIVISVSVPRDRNCDRSCNVAESSSHSYCTDLREQRSAECRQTLLLLYLISFIISLVLSRLQGCAITRMFLQFAAIWSISLYAVPVIAMFAMYQRASLTDNVSYLSKFVAGAGALLVASLAARGYSRSNNPVYVKFVETLNEAQLHYNASTKQELHKYDFEFWAWPVDFDVLELKRLDSISPSTIIIQDVRESLTFIIVTNP